MERQGKGFFAMATILQLDSARIAESGRWVVGIHISSNCRRLAAAVVATSGRGLDLCPRIVGYLVTAVPSETAERFERLARAGAEASVGADELAILRRSLAELEAGAVAELLDRAGVAPGRVIAVGVEDPGLWTVGAAGPRGYVGLCDTACLAESTGLSIIDDFPARDVTRGGLGGPLSAVPNWLLLRSPRTDQILIDLGRTVRLTFLPRGSGAGPASRIASFDIGPGTQLLDLLAERLSGGRHGFDPGGRLGVQGRRIGELVDHWLADPYFQGPVPRWDPCGVDAAGFFRNAMERAVEAGWSVRDMLCSAAHFIAEAIVRAIQRHVYANSLSPAILVCGGGQQNGMLLREIGARLPGVELIRLAELGIGHEVLDPASAAILALLNLDQVPANPPSVTGAELCRVLGRLTPGSPQNWQRLIKELAGATPAVRPLRSAL